jgi:hypothetical protein
MKALPWMRVVWLLQIVIGGFQELEAHERKQARDIAERFYRERHLNPGDRQRLVALARKAGRGAIRGARGRGLSGFGARR